MSSDVTLPTETAEPLNLERPGRSPAGAALFVGRSRELADAEECLNGARRGEPGILIVEGTPGIGKTAFIQRFLEAAGGFRVVRGSGEQSEQAVPFGLADQLLRGAGLGEPGLLGADDAPDPGDHVAAGVRLLEVIGRLERLSPVVVVVDDAHWADDASLRALLFCARRLAHDRVLIVIAVRSDERERLPDGLVRLGTTSRSRPIELSPLEPSELRELASVLGIELSVQAAVRLQRHTLGSPLYSIALLRELPEEIWLRPDERLPAPESFAKFVEAKLETCGPAAIGLVEAAAVAGSRASLATVAKVAGAVADPEAINEAVAARLIERSELDDAPGLAFPHPLVQSAVIQHLSPARSAALHRRAAPLSASERTQLEHLIAASGSTDQKVVEALESYAAAQAKRGIWINVSWALAAAGRITDSEDLAESLALAAAEAALFAGDLERAQGLLTRVERNDNAALRDCLLAHAALPGPRPIEAEPMIQRAWDECDVDSQPETAGRIAFTAALLNVMNGRGKEAASWADRSLELAVPDAPAKAPVRLMLAFGLMYAGRLDEAEAAARTMTVKAGNSPEASTALGWIHLASDRFPEATVELAAAAASALDGHNLEQAALARALLVRAEYLIGDWNAALAHSEQARSLLAEFPSLNVRPIVRWAAALVPAARGDWETTQELAQAAQPDTLGGTVDRVAAAALIRAQTAAAAGDNEVVIDALQPLRELAADSDGLNEPGVWPWHDIYAEALVAVGRLDEAHEFLGPHERLAKRRKLDSALSRLGRVRGRLEAAMADDDAAEATLRAAIESATRAKLPFERGQASLVLGALLRRQRRRRDAAAVLEGARGDLAALNAVPYLERCERELRACGRTLARPPASESAELTPQEEEVARLVASGMTNRDVARELLVSVKTVEAHLTRIYGKLGVTSRTQLAAVVSGNSNPDRTDSGAEG